MLLTNLSLEQISSSPPVHLRQNSCVRREKRVRGLIIGSLRSEKCSCFCFLSFSFVGTDV